MAEKETKSCSDCIHLDVCCKIEHFGRDLETNLPCREFIGVNDRVEVVRCKDCIYVDNGYIGHLYCRFFNSMPVSGMDYCKWGKQKAAASEKEVPVKHGHWVKEKSDVLIHWHCSVCKNCYYLDEPNANYCPNCGAKMDGGEGE